MKNTVILSFLILVGLTFTCSAATIIVDVNGGGEFETIQAAIDDANDGDTVEVWPGIYYENIIFNGKAVTVASTNPDDSSVVDSTIIDANGVGSVVTFANGEGPDTVLTGLTITGGQGTVNTSIATDIYWGGGIYCYLASPTITGNVIAGNNGPMGGGNIYGYGGGIGCIQSDALISRNVIKDNAGYAGAGIMVYLENAEISSNLIYDNSAEVGGGAVLLAGGQLINSTLVGNSATVAAGNVYGNDQFIISNNIISNAISGGGIYLEAPNEPVIAYNDVWNNIGGNYVGIGDQTGLNGNISSDPLFVNVGIHDYHLQSGSLCIDTGDPAYAANPNEVDIDGEFRVMGAWIDIGADEYTDFAKPFADAGTDQLFGSSTLPGLVTLDGSGSFDPNGESITYHWSQTNGPLVTLSDTNVVDPTFVPSEFGNYVFELVVNNGSYDSNPDTVSIIIDNQAPTADAGPDQSMKTIPASITLDGSGSYDPFSDPLTYYWQQIGGPAVVLSDPCVIGPIFVPSEFGIYVFELIVNDGMLDSPPDEVLIFVGNRPPVADAGSDILCQIPQPVTLDGSGSYDPDPVDELTYTWRQLQGPNVVLYNANTANPYFDCNEYSLYEFELIVSDGLAESEPNVVWVVAVTVTTVQQDLDVGYTTDEYYFHYPDVSGDKVLYAVGKACDFSWNIKCKDLKTNQVHCFNCGDGEIIMAQPKIDGNIAVWFGGPVLRTPWFHEPSNFSVFVRNISAHVHKSLRDYTMSESYSHPAVSGNKVVWLEHLGLDTSPLGSCDAVNWYNTPYNICGADITNWNSPTYFTIAQNVGNRDPYACGCNISYASDFDDVIDISGNIAVWEADGDIYGADISDLSAISVFTICDNSARQFDPAICGNIVVWTDERNDGGDIYGADISDMENIEVFEIIKETGTQQQPAIDGPTIVYVDGNLYGQIKVCYLTKYYGALDVALSGSPYGCGPAIDSSTIVWQDNFYGKAQGISLEVAYSIADGVIENLTTGKRYDYIQHAIDDANDGDEIEVPEGTYKENIDFKGKNPILRSKNPDDAAVVAATVIDGSCEKKSVVTFSGGEDANCLLSGFTITGGYGTCTESSESLDVYWGGGIYCIDASPTITNNVIIGNNGLMGYENVYLFGGGIGCDSSSAVIERNIIMDNTADYGGGIMCSQSNAKITNCTISDNSASAFGGGVYIASSDSIISNCTITGNKAGMFGGGILCKSLSPIITNCILWSNSAFVSGDEIYTLSSTPTVNYCDIEGGWTGPTNIGDDPCFVDPGYWGDVNDANIVVSPDDPNAIWIEGDYHLLSVSPCINAGDPCYVAEPDETDLDGRPRVNQSCVDIGAYEFFVPPLEMPMHFTPRTLNPKSKGKWVKAHFILPAGFTVEDVNTNSPARIVEPFMADSNYMDVFINEDDLVKIMAAFDRAIFCSNGSGHRNVVVIGRLTSGQYFYGTDTIRIKTNNLEYLAVLTSYWLAGDCGEPDWCAGADLNRDSVVDFIDFAFFDGCCLEFIKK